MHRELTDWRRWMGVHLLALAAMGAAACGGEDAGTRPAADDPREAYVARADAICRKANDAERRVTGAGDPGDGLSGDAREAGDFVRAGRQALAELREIEPPPGDEQEVARLIRAFERMQAAKESELRAVRAGNRPPEDAEGDFYAAYQDFAAAAGPYGIVECQGVGV